MTNVKCKLEVISNGSLAFTGGYCKQFRKLSISLASSAITDREKGFCLFETLLMTPCAQIDLSLKVRTTPKTQVLESRHCAARDLLFLFFFRFPSKQQQASAKVMSPFGNSTFYLIAI